MAPLVVLEQVERNYTLEGETIRVLKGIDLTIAAGESVAVTGASGVGKSTLLHIVGTLDRPTRGRVRFDGVDLSTLGPGALAAFRNRTIGIVYQFHHLLPDFTAVENVMMPALIGREPWGEARTRARELLDIVGLAHREAHKPGELSGGEQQRVAVARAMMRRPKLLLADELTGNLDERTAAGVHGLLLDLNRSHRTTLLVVTHNEHLAGLMARRVVLADGRVHADSGAADAPAAAGDA